MLRKSVLLILLHFTILQMVNGQYAKLLRLTEQEVRQQVKQFPIVGRDSLEHEMIPYLFFKNSQKESKLFCYFFYDKKCHLVRHITSPSTFKAAVKFANKTYVLVEDNKWISRDSMFTVRIDKFADKVVTSYSRGVDSNRQENR
mgnify:CR=1 FL=1